MEILLTHAIRKFSAQLHKKIDAIHPQALRALQSYHWPGNVREVENVIEYAINMENTDEIRLSSLPDRIQNNSAAVSIPESSGFDLKERLALTERSIIAETLEHTGTTLEGKRQAARMLGISESTLYRRLRTLGML